MKKMNMAIWRYIKKYDNIVINQKTCKLKVQENTILAFQFSKLFKLENIKVLSEFGSNKAPIITYGGG